MIKIIQFNIDYSFNFAWKHDMYNSIQLIYFLTFQ